MNWKERAEAFRKTGQKASQRSNDEAIARKVLRGVGCTEKTAPLLCAALGIDPDGQLMDIAVDAMNSVSGGMFDNMSAARRFVVDVRQIRLSRGFLEGSTVSDICANAARMPYGGGVLVFFRHPTDRRPMCLAFLHEPPDGVIPGWLLRPVSTLVLRRDGVSAWLREVEDLVRGMAEDMRWSLPELEGISEQGG